MCDRGIELADLIGSAPVQYGSIKAIALTEAGRFDEVDAAIAQEVTDDEHPFGQAMASHARSVFLTRIGAWGPALESIDDTLTRAEQVNRVWMQYWAGSLMAVVAAHAGRQADLAAAVTEARVFGEWHHGLTGAQVALAEGDFERVIELAAPACPTDGQTPIADHVRALLAVAHAQLSMGDHPAALDAAERGLALAETMGFGALLWQLRRVRGLALEALGDDDAAVALADAEGEFRVVADRIADLELRSWFERQPLAPPT
jgi:hypothetical protein